MPVALQNHSGLTSTGDDMLRFHREVNHPTILTTASRRLLQTESDSSVFIMLVFPLLLIPKHQTTNRPTTSSSRPTRPPASSICPTQTGPFFVEGAVPGDTLKVHIDKITLNRNSMGKPLVRPVRLEEV
jgi:hypothetical protein